MISSFFMEMLAHFCFDHFIYFMSQFLRQSVLQLACQVTSKGWSEAYAEHRDHRPHRATPTTLVTNLVVVTWNSMMWSVLPWRQRGASTEDWDDEEGYYAAQVERSLEWISPNTLNWWQMTSLSSIPKYITSKWAKTVSSCLGHLQTRYGSFKLNSLFLHAALHQKRRGGNGWFWMLLNLWWLQWFNLSLNHPDCCITHQAYQPCMQVHLRLVNTWHNLTYNIRNHQDT